MPNRQLRLNVKSTRHFVANAHDLMENARKDTPMPRLGAWSSHDPESWKRAQHLHQFPAKPYSSN